MSRKTKVKLTDWLGERDSHTAYDVGFLREELKGFDIEVKVNSSGQVLFSRYLDDGSSAVVWKQSIHGPEFKKRAEQAKHPKGPMGPVTYTDEEAPDLWLLGGWQVASALCGVHGIEPSDSYGRGSAFRKNLFYLKEAGF